MQLREVLTAFEQGGSMSLAEMSRRYDVDPAVLEDMIQFWVRKGRLRDACTVGGCGACHMSGSCAAVTTATGQPHHYEPHRYEPHRYELVTEQQTAIALS